MTKDVCKCFILFVFGLVISAVVYPIFHEMGHIITSLCVGAEVNHVALFPVPSVLCSVASVDDLSKVFIGLGGMVFPVFVSLLIPRKWFLTWYTRMLMQGISVLAFLISFISVIAKINPQDDMNQALQYWDYGTMPLLCILGILTISVIVLIVAEKPGKKMCKYFNI